MLWFIMISYLINEIKNLNLNVGFYPIAVILRYKIQYCRVLA